MTDMEARDIEHATNLRIAGDLIDITWRDGRGCTVPESDLRSVQAQLLAAENKLRDGVTIRRVKISRGD
jgi:hypothetical protein